MRFNIKSIGFKNKSMSLKAALANYAKARYEICMLVMSHDMTFKKIQYLPNKGLNGFPVRLAVVL